MTIIAEYIWIDGTSPTQKLRSKPKVIHDTAPGLNIKTAITLRSFPEWGFDGSSTEQASGDLSDCVLRPVGFYPDPTRSIPNVPAYLVLCEVYNADGSPHRSNTRADLVRVSDLTLDEKPLFGIEQEYTLFKDGKPLGWPGGGYAPKQGPFYCGVGADEVFGRELFEDHLAACLQANILVCGGNAEVMPGQWEYQIGPLGPLEVSDQLWISRYLLYRLGEKYGITAKLDPKPVKELNGAGAHTNFSTARMRVAEGGDWVEAELEIGRNTQGSVGLAAIYEACERLGAKHAEHIAVYGDGIRERLTGHHETCSWEQFRYGVSDRGASIRIPLHVANAKCGYLEDRRPCANIDPYVVTARILKTVCDVE